MVLLNSGVLGGGVFSRRGDRFLRMAGSRELRPFTISVQAPSGTRKVEGGKYKLAITPPFLPKKITDPYHPGGNSLCYMIQTAHLMGCNPIYAVGFTLQSGSRYFFGGGNPVTKRESTLYDTERALDWLQWYEGAFPGRIRLDPTFGGPIYKVFRRAGEDELLGENQGGRGVQPDQNREDPSEVRGH